MEENKPIHNEEGKSPPLTDDSPQQNTQLNNPSTDEPIAEAEQPITHNTQPVTEQDMEVHHHTHTAHGKKNWKSYFWEFLMLFLAVFCGFLAEYQLEHKIERDRAKELARSFYEELKADSLSAQQKVQNRLKQEEALGYLTKYFKDSSLTNTPKSFAINFEYGISFRTPTLFEPRTIMLEQLKNSGSLRYFKNERLQRLIGDLTVAIRNIYDRQALEGEQRLRYINPIIIDHYDYDFDAAVKKLGRTIFEGLAKYEESNDIIPYKINSLEKLDRQNMVNVLNFYNGNAVSSTRLVHIQRYIDINAALLILLRKEYHIK